MFINRFFERLPRRHLTTCPLLNSRQTVYRKSRGKLFSEKSEIEACQIVIGNLSDKITEENLSRKRFVRVCCELVSWVLRSSFFKGPLFFKYEYFCWLECWSQIVLKILKYQGNRSWRQCDQISEKAAQFSTEVAQKYLQVVSRILIVIAINQTLTAAF